MLLFQISARVLGEPQRHPELVEQLAQSWLKDLSQRVAQRRHIPQAQGLVMVRLHMAILRGLMLNLMSTGDSAGVAQALELFERALPNTDPSRWQIG